LEFEGYPSDIATQAVDSLNVDWAAQAVRSAESYLETSSFSQSGLAEQLEFEGFTPEEAAHGAATAYGAGG
jgi:colicin import membrane protein